MTNGNDVQFCFLISCFGIDSSLVVLKSLLQAVEGLAAKWERKVIGGAVIDCS